VGGVPIRTTGKPSILCVLCGSALQLYHLIHRLIYFTKNDHYVLSVIIYDRFLVCAKVIGREMYLRFDEDKLS
jgi:hypothetical protein